MSDIKNLLGGSKATFETVDNANPPSGFVRGDVVRLYGEGTELVYPCLVLSMEKFEDYKFTVLQGLLGHRSRVSEDDTYEVYVHMEGQLLNLGIIPATRLKNVLQSMVFRLWGKVIHLSETEMVEGDMLYALCKM